MRWTELLALCGMLLLAAALVAVPLFLVLNRRNRQRAFEADPDSIPIRTRSAGSTLAQRVVSVAQAVTQSRLVSQIGMVQRITVNSIGYLRARLLPAGGAGLFSLGEEREAVVALDHDYHLEVRHQETPPASYSGARVRLMPVAAPQRLDFVVEGEGFVVPEGGVASLEIKPAGMAGTRLTVRPVKSGPATLRIDCYRDNAWLQSLDLRVEVRSGDEVSALKRIGTPVADLEASATVPAPPAETAQRHLHLRISRSQDPESGSAYTARMSDGRSGWQPLGINLREQDLREINEGLRLALEDFRRFLGREIDLDPKQRASADYLARLDELARQGNYAFKQIFPDAADQAYVRAALSSGTEIGLEIATQDFFLPWEVLYDGYDPAAPPDPERFWGLRYAISRVLTDVRQTAPPVLDFTERLRVSLFADPRMTAVAEEEIPFLRDLGQEGKIALSEWQEEDEASGAELTEAQRRSRLIEFSAARESDVTHFACHAVAAEHGPDSYLYLPRGLRLRIKDMVVEDYVLAGSPFVLLNACGTGIRDPLKTSDFVRRFLLSGGRGVLVTECDVPDGFAAAFVRQLYGRILAGEPLAAALLAVRAHFLREHGNPLGLLYSAYLPLEARLHRSGSAPADRQAL